MKKYIRESQRNGYKTITEVDELGTYHLYSEYIDQNGNVVSFNNYQDTIYKMGWISLKEFLKNKMQHGIIVEVEG